MQPLLTNNVGSVVALPAGKYPHLYDELMALDKNNDGGWVNVMQCCRFCPAVYSGSKCEVYQVTGSVADLRQTKSMGHQGSVGM
jgi:hypothetical protein